MDGWMGVEGEREKERLRRLTPDELNNRIPKKKKKKRVRASMPNLN